MAKVRVFFQEHYVFSTSQQKLGILAIYQFAERFCYSTADLVIHCAEFKLMEIKILVYLYAVRSRPAALILQ